MFSGALLDTAALFHRGHEVPVGTWLVVLAGVSLCLAGLSAGYLVWDVAVRGRQMMTVMKWVWPITALYVGPFAIWAYRALQVKRGKGEKTFWQQVFTGTTHCGAGCTLGDVAGEFLVFGLGASLLRTLLPAELLADLFFAYVFGVAFQYFSIAPMRGTGGMAGLRDAIKADTLSIAAFQVGLFGWMALYEIVIFQGGLHPNSPVYWLLMQVGMVLGFATSYPVNWWLLHRGIKEPM